MEFQFSSGLEGEQPRSEGVGFCEIGSTDTLSWQCERFDASHVREIELQVPGSIHIDTGGAQFFEIGVHFHDTPEARLVGVLMVDLEDEPAGDGPDGAEVHHVSAAIQVELNSGRGRFGADIETEFRFAADGHQLQVFDGSVEFSGAFDNDFEAGSVAVDVELFSRKISCIAGVVLPACGKEADVDFGVRFKASGEVEPKCGGVNLCCCAVDADSGDGLYLVVLVVVEEDDLRSGIGNRGCVDACSEGVIKCDVDVTVSVELIATCVGLVCR